MAICNITADELRAIVTYDEEAGLMYRSGTRRGPKPKALHIGSKNRDGYLFSMIHGKTYAIHQLVWLYVTGEWPNGEVDHINGNRADNRFVNLRCGDKSANQQNRRVASRNSKSGFLGVHYCKHRNKWRAVISINGRNQSLGRYETPEEAYSAYVDAKRSFHLHGTL